jgi:hypothetical protein
MSKRAELERERLCKVTRFKGTQRTGRITFTVHEPTEFYGRLLRYDMTRIGTDIPSEFTDEAAFLQWLQRSNICAVREETDYREPLRQED